MLTRIEGAKLVTEGVVTEIERKTLIELRDLLQSGEITSFPSSSAGQHLDTNRRYLDMDCWYELKCGTVGCIAGLCWELSKGEAFDEIVISRGDSLNSRAQLIPLFLPLAYLPLAYLSHRRDCSDITPTEVIHAITTFLATGKPQWNEPCP